MSTNGVNFSIFHFDMQITSPCLHGDIVNCQWWWHKTSYSSTQHPLSPILLSHFKLTSDRTCHKEAPIAMITVAMQIHFISPRLTRHLFAFCPMEETRNIANFCLTVPFRGNSINYTLVNALLLADNKMHGQYFSAVCIAIAAIAAISCIVSAGKSISSLSRHITIDCIATHWHMRCCWLTIACSRKCITTAIDSISVMHRYCWW